MANSYTVLADLRAGRCSNTAEVRLLRFWEAKNINKRGQLMSLEMLLIDEQSTLVQGSVPASFQLMFRGRLTEGSVYNLSGFDVTRSSPKFKLSDGPISIHFNEGTTFEKIETTSRMIPTEHFRFQPYEQILELANTGKQLPDVMGELRAIRSTITDRLPGAQRVMLTLRLAGEVDVCVSMFDSLALAFHSKFDGFGREPKIVLVTAINPKIVSGRLPGGGADQGGSSTKVIHAQKIEPLTIAELDNFVLTGDPQGWCSIGCSVCSTKLMREESSFTCLKCNLPNAVARLRYRVIFSVSDVTGIAGFVCFDEEVAKLTHVLASEAAQIVGIGVNAQVDTEFPRSLADVVGNTYIFQLKLKDFNFTPNHQTFTVSRIFPAQELAPIPSFAVRSDTTPDEGPKAPEPAIPPTVVPGSDSIGESSNVVAEQAITSDGLLAGVKAAGEGVGVEGSVPKKPRVG
ncbi:hypothetical protein Bca4012_064109 [Brassica carinata]